MGRYARSSVKALRIGAIAVAALGAVGAGIYGVSCALEPDKPARRREDAQRRVLVEDSPRARRPHVRLRAASPTADATVRGERALRDAQAELGEDAFDLESEWAEVKEPTITIDGVPYEGGRRAYDLARRICVAIERDRPAACDHLRPPSPIAVTILTDVRCADCDVERAKKQVEDLLTDPMITVLDHSEPRGAALWSAIKPRGLPAIVVSGVDADASPDARMFATPPLKVGADYVLSTDDWIPDCADPGGCAQPMCADQLVCAAERPATLELWILGQSPPGASPLFALATLKRHFASQGVKLAVEVHTIGTDNGAGLLTSYNGKNEVDEDRRDLCVGKKYPAALVEFLICRTADYKAPWEDCAGGATGIGVGVVGSCAASATEGGAMVQKDYADSERMGIEWSPTWVVNGRWKHYGVDAETVKNAVCGHNPGMAGCAVSLGRVSAARKVPARPRMPAGVRLPGR